MDSGATEIDTQTPNPVGETMKAIRKLRRMSASEVARAMKMPPRSYENLESGTGRVTYARIVEFADVTNSDPIAILMSTVLGCPDFALRCADNKLMKIMMLAMQELDADLGNDIIYLNAQTLVSGFTRLSRDLAQHVRNRETFAEEWLNARSTRLKPNALPMLKGRLSPRRT